MGAQTTGDRSHRVMLAVAELRMGVDVTGEGDDLRRKLGDDVGQCLAQSRRGAVALPQGGGWGSGSCARSGLDGHPVLNSAAGLSGTGKITHRAIMLLVA